MKSNLSTIIRTARLAAGRWCVGIVLLCAAGVRAAEPTFTNVTATVAPSLPGVAFSSVAWGDYDNDGRLDFLLTGSGFSQLWRNTGSGFTNMTASVAPGLPGVWSASAAWGDYDNDGRLDFLLTGSGFSQLWRNTGSRFTNVTATVAPGLLGVTTGSVAWGDYDNDGRLDFLLTGERSFPSVPVSQLWRNTGNGFVNVTDTVAPGLPGVEHSAVAWGDYDDDGRLDFLLTGGVLAADGYFIPVSQLWRNTASGFVNVTDTVAPGLPGVEHSSVAWGDYDDDGRLDFLLTGSAYPNLLSQLWRNTGSGFTNVTATVASGLPGVLYSSAAWGDYDNDGRLDFLLTGYSYDGNFHPVSQLWRNTGSGFTNETARVAPGLPGVIWPSVAWGDYDDDGRLDFLLTGRTNASVPGAIAQLWQNHTGRTNPPPAVIARPPVGTSQTSVALNVSIHPHRQATTVWFLWGDSTNYGHTTTAQPVGNGNSFTNFSVTITGLTAGVTYYCRAVGSNDQGLVIPGFEQHFTLAAPVVTTSPAGNLGETSATLNGQVHPNNFPTYGWFEWGRDLDDGLTTPVQFLASGFGTPFSENLSGLESGFTYYYRAVASNSLGVAYGAVQSLFTPCPGYLSPPSVSHGYDPAPNSVFFWVGCDWTAINTNSWITITSARSGTAGYGTLNYTPAVNTDPQPRSGNITIGGTNFFVEQAGGHPVIVRAPSDQTVLVGGTATFKVTLLGTAPVTIQWQFNHVPLTNGSGISGASTTNLVLTGVQKSQAGEYRALVAGLYSSPATLTVSCGFTLAASNASLSSLSATGSVTLNAEVTNCAWSVVNTNPWLTILSSIIQIGPGTVVYALAANPTTMARSESILIADQTFTITQSGGAFTNAAISLPEALDEDFLLWSTIGTQAWFGQTLISQDGVDAAQSGSIGDSAAVTVQARFLGPGTLRYWWKVSSETNKDFLKFFVNGVQQTRISGEVDWQLLNYDFPSGTYTSKWTYSKNDSKALGNDRGWLDQVQFDSATGCPVTLSPGSGFHPTNVFDGSFSVTAAAGCAWSVVNTNPWLAILSSITHIGPGTVVYALAANPTTMARSGSILIADQTFTITQSGGAFTNAAISLPEALDEGFLLWSTIGTPAWFGQTLISQDGVDAAQSGSIGDSAAVTVQARFLGPGTLSYWWKVSSETNKDFLKFFVNGVQQTRISGEVDWQLLNYAFSSGTYTSKWTYSKNDSNALGNDRGWLDQVQFSSATGCPVTLSPGSGFHPTNASDGSFRVTAAAGCAWSVLNTNSWISVASGANGIGNGTVAYTVTANPAAPTRRGHLLIANRLFVVTQSPSGDAPRLQFMTRIGAQVTLSVQGEPGKTYVLEASQDLNLWRAISTNSAPSTVTDAAAGDAPWRFYRTVEIP